MRRWILLVLVCLLATVVARAQEAAVQFVIDGTPPMQRIDVSPLTATNTRATKFRGSADLVHDGGVLALDARLKRNARKGTALYRLKSPGRALPKFRAKIKVAGAPPAVTRAKLVFKIAKGEKAKLRDASKVWLAPVVTTTTMGGSTTTTSTIATTTTLPGSTTTTTTMGSTTTTTTLYPSFVDAPPEALTRLDEVLASATDLLNGGGTYGDVQTLLAGEPDVADVRVDGVTMYFTVAGLPTGLHDGQAARLRSSPPAPPAPGASVLAQAIGPVPGGVAAGMPPTGQRVVGADRNGDGRRDVAKRALVLSPYAYQFGSNDSGPTASAALSARGDYAGGVDVHAVASTPTSLFPLTYYTSWDDYDVIHVSTHGDTNLLLLGSAPSTCTAAATAIKTQLPDPLDRTGLDCFAVNVAAKGNVPAWTKANVTASPAFFVWHYPGGLNKKVIVLDACRTTFQSGLVDAMLGTDSIVIGWDEYVDSAHSKATVAALYQDAAGLGYPVWRSFVRQCGGGACIEPMSAGLASGQTKFAEAEIAYDRADLRIREGLHVVEPITTGVCVEIPGQPLDLTCPSCTALAIPMVVAYGITIDGVVPEDLVLRQDPLEFAIEQLRLFADADGTETGYAFPVFDAVVESTGDGQWTTSVPNGVSLYVDGVCPGDVVDYLPKLMLPAYDPAAPGNDNRDFMYPLDGPYPLTFDAP